MGVVMRFIRNSGIFILGSVLSKAIAFLMLPLYTAVVPPADFGYYDLSITYLTVICESLFLDIWVVILREMYKDADGAVRPLQAGSLVFAGSAVVYSIACAAVFLLFDVEHLVLIAVLGLVQNIDYVYKHACRGLRRNWDFAVSGILASVVMMGMNVVLLVGLDWDFRALYASTIIAYLCEMAYLEIRVGIVRRMVGQTWDWAVADLAKALAVLALPVGLNAAVYWTINSLNRAVVSVVLDLSDNGLYAIAMRFGSLMMLVIMAMTYAWQDLAFERDRRAGAFFSTAASAYATVLLFGFALLIPLLKIVFPWVVAPQYAEAAVVVPFALAVSTWSGYSNFLVNIFYAIGRNAQTFWAIGIAGAVNVIGVYPLVASMGLIGASASTVIGYSAGIVYMLWRLRREIGMRIDLRGPLAALTIVIIAMLVFQYGTRWANLALAITLLLVGVGVGVRVVSTMRSRASGA